MLAPPRRLARVYGGDRAADIAEAEELCPRHCHGGGAWRSSSDQALWRLLAYCANGRIQNDEDAEAAERELHYARLAGDTPSDTTGLDLALVLGTRPADEALHALEQIAEGLPRERPTLDGRRC